MSKIKNNDWILKPTGKQLLVLACSWLLGVTLILIARDKPFQFDYSFWLVLTSFILIVIAMINYFRSRK